MGRIPERKVDNYYGLLTLRRGTLRYRYTGVVSIASVAFYAIAHWIAHDVVNGAARLILGSQRGADVIASTATREIFIWARTFY